MVILYGGDKLYAIGTEKLRYVHTPTCVLTHMCTYFKLSIHFSKMLEIENSVLWDAVSQH